MSEKKFYYYDFSSLDMTAEVLTGDANFKHTHRPSGIIYGPFDTKQECRKSLRESFSWIVMEYKMAFRDSLEGLRRIKK